MDSRLEKIRYFKANVMDFESYINDRIKQTKEENSKVEESLVPRTQGSFVPNENVPEDCIAYIISNIENFDSIYDKSLVKIGRMHCSLRYADPQLFEKIYDLANEWLVENDYDECDIEDIEEIFG